jgi:hypothetical protein
MRLRRRPVPPSEVRAHLASDPVLAAAELVDDSWAVASPRALVLADASARTARILWHEVLHGKWDGETRSLDITFVDPARDHVVLATKDDDVQHLADTIRERVTSSLVHTLRRELPNGSTVQVHIRRAEGGELISQTTTDGPLTGTREEAAVILASEAEARGAVGLAG